ncbi:MAG: MBOAT family protein [Verrucomicrobia bacterium]|nr:MBOAT family protein [Verrucomicrobiota bacterium]
MLFNTFEFIFWFFPITLAVYLCLQQFNNRELRYAWLAVASLFFYAWWNPQYLILIAVSMLFNYGMGRLMLKEKWRTRRMLALGIGVNLLTIGYYKYAGFFIENTNALLNGGWRVPDILLPLGISFFTFQQITYLVDSYRHETKEYNFIHYCLFVSFFPQLIAGPIVHHREMLPQFERMAPRKKQILRNLIVGLSIFALGLFKKSILADNLALIANPVFQSAELGRPIDFLSGWMGALGYTFQLYFDFSGYSDMAIGLGRCFGIRLPVNFNSPYKSRSIVEFWRRWHMTLSRFLREYLYFPLGGSRKGRLFRYRNLMITMLLGGLWHGAGWTFVIWGGLHGLYICINHGWHHLKPKWGLLSDTNAAWKILAQSITFLAVVISWVLFRAESLDGALAVLNGMIGSNGMIIPKEWIAGSPALSEWLSGAEWAQIRKVRVSGDIRLILCAFLLCFLAPNSMQLFRSCRPYMHTAGYKVEAGRPRWFQWAPSPVWACFIAVILLYCLVRLNRVSEFIYFNF